jgi:hypothetical protein
MGYPTLFSFILFLTFLSYLFILFYYRGFWYVATILVVSFQSWSSYSQWRKK